MRSDGVDITYAGKTYEARLVNYTTDADSATTPGHSTGAPGDDDRPESNNNSYNLLLLVVLLCVLVPVVIAAIVLIVVVLVKVRPVGFQGNISWAGWDLPLLKICRSGQSIF